MSRPRRIVALSLVVLGLSMGGPLLPSPSAGAEPPSVVLVTKDCANANFICPGFRRAAKRTGTRARIISPDPREDIVGTFTLLARQGHDLVIGDPDLAMELDEAARRSPDARFAVFDLPLPLAEGRSANVAAIELRAREAAYLAGWLATRMERLRRGPDVIGVVGGYPIPPVDEFIVGYRAGAHRASPAVRVLTDYSSSFTDPTECGVLARRQIARGAGTVFDVAGGCGPGTLSAARDAGAWAIGVDLERSGLGSHILTSVVKRYDRGFALLMRQARGRRLPAGRSIVFGLHRGGSELGRISRRVPARVLVELAAVRREIVSGRIRVPGPPTS